jgi:putative peptidoglycan lipid II flippase
VTSTQASTPFDTLSQLTRNTAVTTFFSMLAVVSGVVLDGVMVAIFGLGAETDAYFIASLLPLVAITILYLQAGKVVQPLFIHTLYHEERTRAWHFLNGALTTITAVAAVAGILCLPFASRIIAMQAPGATEATRIAAIGMTSVLFLVPALYGPITIMREALIALGNFTLTGSLKFVDNLVKVAIVVLLVRQWGIFAIAVGMVGGAVVQIVLLYMTLHKRHGFRYRPALTWGEANARTALRSSGYPLVGHVSSAATDVVQSALASLAGVGAVSALRLATRIIDAIAGVLANSVVVALMPLVTHSLAGNDPEKMKENLRHGLQLLLLLTIPASLGLLLINGPLIALVFERMNFSAADTQLVSTLLVLMIPYILLSRVFGLAELGFYGACDTRTPLAAGLGLSATYVVAMRVFFPTSGIHGLAYARSLSYLVGTVMMMWILRRRFGHLGLSQLAGRAGRIVAASAVMMLFVLAGRALVGMMGLSALPLRIVAVGLPTALGLVGLVVSGVWLGVINIGAIFNVLRREVHPSVTDGSAA